MKPRRYTVGELFAGAGGLALGARRAGLKLEWLADADADACATLRRNFPRVQICHEDINVTADIYPHGVDVLSFGFPCNDFSISGKQRGERGKFGGLWTHCRTVLADMQPAAFVAENVPGLCHGKNKPTFARIIRAFEKCGYNVRSQIYKAEFYGVPQRRRRLIIVGTRNDLGVDFHHAPHRARLFYETAGRAIAAIPADAANNESPRHSATVVNRLKKIPPGANAASAGYLPPRLRLAMHSPAAKFTYSGIYRRLHPDAPSSTVTCANGGDRRLFHHTENRALTNREIARLQTFPDSFVFTGGVNSVRRQIGNAVPPALSAVVFSTLRDAMHAAGVPPDSVV